MRRTTARRPIRLTESKLRQIICEVIKESQGGFESRRPVRLTESKLRQIIRSEIIKEARGGFASAIALYAAVHLTAASVSAIFGLVDMIKNNELQVVEHTLPHNDGILSSDEPEEVADAILQALSRGKGADIKSYYQGNNVLLEVKMQDYSVVIDLTDTKNSVWAKLTNILRDEIEKISDPDARVSLSELVKFLDRSNPGYTGKYAKQVIFKPITSHNEY